MLMASYTLLLMMVINGIELWRSDGTEEGTELFVNLTQGNTNYASIGAVNGLVVFSAEIGFFNVQLFSSDGSSLYQIGTFDGSLFGQFNFRTVNDTLFFSGYDDENRRELWKTDGFTAEIVKDINTNYNPNLLDTTVGYSRPESLIGLNDTLYFTAEDKDGGDRELWQSDGTEAGTQKVVNDPVTELTSANAKLYFVKTTGNHKRFYQADENGDYELFNFKFDDGITDIVELKEHNNIIYFKVLKDAAPTELWSYDTVIGEGSEQQLATGCTP